MFYSGDNAQIKSSCAFMTVIFRWYFMRDCVGKVETIRERKGEREARQNFKIMCSHTSEVCLSSSGRLETFSRKKYLRTSLDNGGMENIVCGVQTGVVGATQQLILELQTGRFALEVNALFCKHILVVSQYLICHSKLDLGLQGPNVQCIALQ